MTIATEQQNSYRNENVFVFLPLPHPTLSTGFGLVGIPENLIKALRQTGAKDLRVISNESG